MQGVPATCEKNLPTISGYHLYVFAMLSDRDQFARLRTIVIFSPYMLSNVNNREGLIQKDVNLSVKIV